MPEPIVSVIIGAYNAMPYLTRCVESVLEQSIGVDELECVVVDDGSTDGTGAELDRFAAAHPATVRVVHQSNSGGASAPRNVALGLARGRYVFFLDADDHLGPDALRRMSAMADRNGSDVVLGKYVGANGNRVPRSMFGANVERADLADSPVWNALAPHKLFRRAFVERHRLRFDEDIRIGEDRLFVVRAYLLASAVSVVADRDCYYKVQRADDGNITSNFTDLMERFEVARRLMGVIAEAAEPGPVRDAAILRHFRGGLLDSFNWRFLRLDDRDRDRALRIARQQLDDHYTPEIAARIPALSRLYAHLVQHDMRKELEHVVEYVTAVNEERRLPPRVMADRGRAYLDYPYFRDGRAGVPDFCYDITAELRQDDRLDSVTWSQSPHGPLLRLRGHGYIGRIDSGRTDTEIVLRLRDDGREVRVPARVEPSPEVTRSHGLGPGGQVLYDYGQAGFTAKADVFRALDGRPLTEGIWDVHLSVRAHGLDSERRFGARRAQGTGLPPAIRVGGLMAKPYFTAGYGNLSLIISPQDAVPRGVRTRVRPVRTAPMRLRQALRRRLSRLRRQNGG